MSIMNPLPPQAYTKDTLVQAYAWLQGQSENIKEMATTPDVLVSLFLKAKLQGDGALERPSIQNFKNELKNLAGMIGEFEILEPQPAGSGNSVSDQLASSTIRFRSQNLKSSERNASSSTSGGTAFSSQANAQSHSLPPPSQPHAQVADSTPSKNSEPQRMDFRSMDMIQEVKSQFNLSSDTEAMRLLIAIGYNQVKNLLK